MGDPIAIVGIGCRFPGGADDARQRSGACSRDGVDAVSEVPADRLDVDASTMPIPTRARARCTRAGAGSSSDVDRFDAAVLRHLAARGRAASIRSSGCCSRSPGRRSRTPACRPTARRVAHRRLRRHLHARLRRHADVPGEPAADRRALAAPARPRSIAANRFRTSRPARPELRGRHRVLVVADRRAPRVPEPARRASATWRSPAACRRLLDARD